MKKPKKETHRQQAAVRLEANLRNALSRRWQTPVQGPLVACWERREPAKAVPHLLSVLQRGGAECEVLAATLSDHPRDDPYWIELLDADESHFYWIAQHYALLARANDIRHQRLVQQAIYLRWRGYRVGLLNCAKEKRAVGALLAECCDLAIVWHWRKHYHLCLVSRRLNCLQVGSKLGRVQGNPAFARVERKEPFFQESRRGWWVGLPLVAIGVFALTRSSAWTTFIPQWLKRCARG